MVIDSYYVVLEHKGIKRMASFENKREFNAWYVAFKNIEKIVAEGITAKEAIKMSDCIDNGSNFANSIIELDEKQSS